MRNFLYRFVGGFIFGFLFTYAPIGLEATAVSFRVAFALACGIHVWMVFNPIACILGFNLDEWGVFIHPGKILLGIIYLVSFCLAFYVLGLYGQIAIVIFITGFAWFFTFVLIALGFILMTLFACVAEYLGAMSFNLPRFVQESEEASKPVKVSSKSEGKPRKSIVHAYQSSDGVVTIVADDGTRSYAYGKLAGFTGTNVSVKPNSSTDKTVNQYDVDGKVTGNTIL